eukprot:gb/GEZN01001355.1/.p1 GENE.gb/GEZN01001355.1/~~gb/GEZN01001355.1/.p1  ORF type:complete len:809 (+),score=118.22 gb/GEZN01001355.1/:29-2455(+)
MLSHARLLTRNYSRWENLCVVRFNGSRHLRLLHGTRQLLGGPPSEVGGHDDLNIVHSSSNKEKNMDDHDAHPPVYWRPGKTLGRSYMATGNKVVSLSDAVEVVKSGDTFSCSGFVCQGAPEALLQKLGERYVKTGTPHKLTLFFGGGPGDWDKRGLNHLAKTKEQSPNAKFDMVSRTIGGHYGQVPMVADLVLKNKVQAYCLPMGSISRMIRAAASHVPGHLTTIGVGTFVDPAISGGKINDLARKEGSDIVTTLMVDGLRHLFYRAVPIDVAFIRATTADPDGNLTMEHEALKADQRIMAMAAKNNGGIVVAQVKRLAATGSLNAFNVAVPGCLVDCVVVIPDEKQDEWHGMSYNVRHNPAWSQEIRLNSEDIPQLPLNDRKIIARRASMVLQPNKNVNLGIGMPEAIASVAAEERILEFITLTTEPGAIGGLPASGHDFGPAANANAIQEMNQQFDFYGGGGLEYAFLGAGTISPTGDVNVSRIQKNKLTGPGGFIDITQSTRNVIFMCTFTAGGLEVKAEKNKLKIITEGKIKKFVKKEDLYEITFSGDEARRRGQRVWYVTERAVFRLTDTPGDPPELMEIAPGVDLQKDVLDQMDFKPLVSPFLREMESSIFGEMPMNLREILFGKTVKQRLTYNEGEHTIFLDLSGLVINNSETLRNFAEDLEETLYRVTTQDGKGKVNMVVNYDGFDCRVHLEDDYYKVISNLDAKYYKSVRRYTTHAFRRLTLGRAASIQHLDEIELFKLFDKNGDGLISPHELRLQIQSIYGLRMTDAQIHSILGNGEKITQKVFQARLTDFLGEKHGA